MQVSWRSRDIWQMVSKVDAQGILNSDDSSDCPIGDHIGMGPLHELLVRNEPLQTSARPRELRLFALAIDSLQIRCGTQISVGANLFRGMVHGRGTSIGV